ncbi:Indolepyruvate ferredoxin oxidoreductase, alpha and beta subunits [Alteromonadaceae bacterium Bs31]|nr:Indolepyruvate ferredoxin oxidoreductase, alpha and beta subunits [Alteromonadaceae bacterium Bs31]
MAVEIVDLCVNCWACVDVCPSDAISEGKPHMLVNAKKCTECEGDYADPQCASICPIESAILDASGLAINPPGSLTGIPPERLQHTMNEIQAR